MISGASHRTSIANCPGCGANIRLREPVRLGEFVICDECGDELEIVSVNPTKLDWAFEEPFDEDDEDFDEELADYEYDDFEDDEDFDDDDDDDPWG